MVSSILILIAAILNSFMDRTATLIHFNTSVFSHLNPRFWCREVAGDFAIFIPHTKYKVDAWHIAKSLMLFAFTFAIVFYSSLLSWYIDFAIYGSIWILVFNMFYNRIFKSNKAWLKGFTID